MMEKLWGEHYYDLDNKKWSTNRSNSCQRGFVKLCYEPIKQIITACVNDQKDFLWPTLASIGVTMESEERHLMGKDLIKCVMQKWLPATELLEILVHLPSPRTAQQYRVHNLYKGPLDDQYANAIRNCDPNGPLMVVYGVEDSGAHVVSGVGELHLKTCMDDLQGDFMGEAKIVVSEPFASFSEIVSQEAPDMVMGVSSNKRNQICMKARKMGIILTDKIENGKIDPNDDPEVNGKILSKEFGWDKDLATIWCFGPKRTGPNIVVDTHKGIEHLSEIKAYVTAAFQSASGEGVLAGESMRGICFEICDATLDDDPIHRGGDQVIPTAWRLFHEAQLAAKPRLVEPLYLVEIQAPELAVEEICCLVKEMRGCACKKKPGIPMWKITAYVPVVESFKFSKDLKEFTADCPSPQLVCDHWKLLDSDPLADGSLASKFVNEIRKRKGKQVTPLLNSDDPSPVVYL